MQETIFPGRVDLLWRQCCLHCEKTTGFQSSFARTSPFFNDSKYAFGRTLRLPLNVLSTGMYAQVIAMRRLRVIFAPAPWPQRPLWKLQSPAFIGTPMGSTSAIFG